MPVTGSAPVNSKTGKNERSSGHLRQTYHKVFLPADILRLWIISQISQHLYFPEVFLQALHGYPPKYSLTNTQPRFSIVKHL